MDLHDDLQKITKFFYQEQAKRELLDQNKKDLVKQKKHLDKDIDTLEKVSILFQKTAQYAREQGKVQIENLTTRSLNYIFKEDYKFIVELTEKRSSPWAEFYIEEKNENGTVKTRPEESKGGGIVDIVSLALRLSFLENFRPKIQGPLILDEPGKHVSEEYTFEIGDFLSEFSRQMNRQIIMITHNTHLAAIGDKTFVVEQNNGVSNVYVDS